MPTKSGCRSTRLLGSFFCQHIRQDLLEPGQPPQQITGPGGVDSVIHVQRAFFGGKGIKGVIMPQVQQGKAPFFLQIHQQVHQLVVAGVIVAGGGVKDNSRRRVGGSSVILLFGDLASS